MVKDEEKESADFQEEIPAGNKERNSEGIGGFVMSKGVLIVDMPDSCFNCNFHNYHYCYAVQCINEDGDCVEKYLKDEVPGKTKPDWCPVKELPKNPSEEYILPKEYSEAWNDCLDAILGDGSNLSSGE